MSHVVGALTCMVASAAARSKQWRVWWFSSTRNKEPRKVEWVSQETFRELYIVLCTLDVGPDLRHISEITPLKSHKDFIQLRNPMQMKVYLICTVEYAQSDRAFVFVRDQELLVCAGCGIFLCI